jgi:hypothetical protein
MRRVFTSAGLAASAAAPPVPLTILAVCLLPGLVVGFVSWHGYPISLFAPNHQLVVRNYLNIWAGGHLAAEGRLDTIFDPQAYFVWLRSVFGAQLDLHSWGYPPQVLLLALPFSWLPLVPGFVAWTIATSLFLWFILRAGGLSRAYALAAALSPAALENALDGQNGALTAAALAGGLLLAGRRPITAGALLALLTMKPQLGLLVPICLLAARDWRTIGWTALFSLAYCGAGLAAFGWHAWSTYLTITAPFMQRYIDAPFGIAAHFMMVPPFITMRAAGASLAWAYRVQTVASLVFAVLAWLAWFRPRTDRRAAVALVLFLAPLSTPYSHSYDLVCVAAGCALLAKLASERGGLRAADRVMLAPAWIWPGSAFAIGVELLPGLGAFCVGLAAIVAIRFLRAPAGASELIPQTRLEPLSYPS